MANSLRDLRRAATQLAIPQAIKTTASLPIGVQRSIITSSVAIVSKIPMLRRRVRQNMRLALGDDVPAEAASRYYRHLGWLLSSSLATFHHGIAAMSVPEEIAFDDSIRHYDEAVAEGRGVIFISPHWLGHKFVAVMVNRRHPLVMLVRQASTSEQMARKLKWHGALGAEIVLRPKQASTIKDAVAYLKVLKSGKVLGISPDLLADAGEGVETRIFGRPARLHPGAFALVIAARAPMVRVHFRWQSDSRLVVTFERAPFPVDAGDRDATIRAAVLDWCGWFEDKLRVSPENWLFWLDKRWSRFWRASARGTE